MHLWQKIVATTWSSLLAVPFLFLCFAYARAECGEMDPCATGGAMPYAGVAIALFLTVALAQAGFLVMIWRIPGPGD